MCPAACAAVGSDSEARVFGAHPRCSDRSSAFDREAAHAADVLVWPAAALLCGTRLEGGHRRLLPTLRSTVGRAATTRLPRCRSAPCARHVLRPCLEACAPARRQARKHVARRARSYKMDHPSYGQPLDELPHRPEETLVSTLEASSAQESGRRPMGHMSRVSGLPLRTRRTCLSSEGGTKVSPRGAEVYGALAIPGQANATTSRIETISRVVLSKPVLVAGLP